MKSNMKSFAMRLSVMLALFYLAGCDGDEPAKEPEKGKYETVIDVYPPLANTYDNAGQHNLVPDVSGGSVRISGATIRLFATEADYLLNENPVHEFLSSDTPYIDATVYDFEETFYWVLIKKGNLNTLRQAMRYRKTNRYGVDRGYYTYGFTAALSTTPTRLRITVVDQGIAVEGAAVQLYFSEADYTNGMPAQNNKNEVAPAYGVGYAGSSNPAVDLVNFFSALTDTNGEVYFDNLEPRQYWIKITKGSKSNSSGTIKTSSALPDNPGTITTLTIGIN